MSDSWGTEATIDPDGQGLVQRTRITRIGPGVTLPAALGAVNQNHGIVGTFTIIRLWAVGDVTGLITPYPNGDLNLSLIGPVVILVSTGPDLSAGTATIYVEYIPT